MGGDVTNVDVVVVGGGMAGVSAAFELVEAGADVVLVEAEAQLAHHTTGRSAAMYLPGYGPMTVRALTRASRVDFERLTERFEVPLLTEHPLLWIADDETQHELEAELAAAPGLARISLEEAAERCDCLRTEVLTGAALDAKACDIDVMALHGGYVSALRAGGGRIERAARVDAVAPVAGGWEVQAGADLTVRARTVVDAAGAWADVVAGLAGVPLVGLHPLRRTIFTSPAHWPHPIEDWPLVVDAGERFYFKPEQTQVLVSLADETPMAPCDVRHEPEDVALAIDRVNARTTLGLRSVQTAWAGLRSFVADRVPVVGEAEGHPGFVWLAGQGGYGIQSAPALARSVTSLITTGVLPADVVAEGVDAGQLAPGRPGLPGPVP